MLYVCIGKKHTGRVWEKAAKMQEKWFNSPAKNNARENQESIRY